MNKYRIIPKIDNEIFQFADDAFFEEETREALECSAIVHIEVAPEKDRWEILLKTPKMLDDNVSQELTERIKSDYHVGEVILYQQVIDIEKALSETWPLIVCKIAEEKPAAAFILRQISYKLKGSRLTLLATGMGREFIIDTGIPKKIEGVVRELLGFHCSVGCISENCSYSEEKIGEELDFAEEYAPPIEADFHQGTASESKGKSDGSSTKEKIKPESKKQPAPSIIAAGNGIICGKAIRGEITPIGDIKGEIKNVNIIGTVGSGQISGIRTKEFKTGTILLTFCVADNTDGIACKKFFKDKEKDVFEQTISRMKSGMEVMLHGSVRFDTYQNEYVLIVDSIAEYKTQKRMDNAEEKRIELHAHTTMSVMDAVVTVKNLVNTAAKWGMKAVAITDHGVVQAFPDAAKAGKDAGIKIIYGMEGYLVHEDYEQKGANHIIILAKNPVGLRNLYQLVTLSHLKYFHRTPRLPKKILAEFREGLILGSACEAGELIRGIVSGKTEEELREIAEFYDYLEIQPIGNNEFLKRSENFPNIKTDEDLRNVNLKVADLARKMGKPLVATGDVHFLNPEDSLYRAILMTGKGYEDADFQPPLYLKTTEEMLEEFSYLGEEEAYKAVVTNPGKIEELVEVMKPIPDDLYSPSMPGAEEEIRRTSYAKAKELYGENLPDIVKARLEQELVPIIGHGFSVLYLIAQKLVEKSMADGYLVGSRGSVGSSFIATMTGITEVNPLPPHYRCPKCKYSEFITDGSVGCGYDLPSKNCPKCGEALIKDGHDIPFAVFLGFDGDKVPDIDLNFSGVYQPVAHKFTETMFGKDFAYRAGTIATVAEKTAYGYVMHYFEDKGLKKHKSFIEHIAAGCQGVKRTTGQHPAGIMVVPRNMDIHFFTPLQHPADDKESGTITTHFDYHSISSRLVKLDILGHDDPTMIRMLEDLIGIDAKTIPFDDPETMSIFSSTEALGLDPEVLGANSGTFGIPEFRTAFTRQMIDDTHPDCFSDLVRISGFSHGTDVWLGNAQDLIRSGTCTLKNAISARDDIMMYLIHHGIDPLLSFKTMEGVRKGKGIKDDVVKILRDGGVPEWYIESCQKIKYLFPRAHATAYVMMAFRIAYCKVHYPLAFYAAYFSIRADEFDANVVSEGKERIHHEIELLHEKAKEKKLDVKDGDTLLVLELAWEMYLRGFGVERVRLYESDATKFIMGENTLLPPLSSIPGVGDNAAKGIAEARKDGPFTSIDDMRRRAGVNKTAVEALKNHGCLKNLAESDQISLSL